MKRIFPWAVIVILVVLLTKIMDLSIQYVKPVAEDVSDKISSSITETMQTINLASSSPLSRLNLDNSRISENVVIPEGYVAVVRVVDGDTIDIMDGDKKVRVRLIGVNTPETVDPRRTVECFGKEASQKTKDLLLSGVVRLEGDESQDTYDKYGRRLSYVYTNDGTHVNLELVKAGYAYEYTYRTPYKFQTAFKDAERVARIEGRGLWAPGACAETLDATKK